MSFCQDTSTQRWTVADVRQTFWVMTSSCILSVRNCREIQLLYLISSSQQSWHCAQQQANRSDGLVTVQTRKSWHPDDASPAPCCIAGHAKAYLRTVDSDVVVLAVNFFQESCLEELWIGFRSWKTSTDIPIHHISQLQSWALPDAPPSSVRSLVVTLCRHCFD